MASPKRLAAARTTIQLTLLFVAADVVLARPWSGVLAGVAMLITVLALVIRLLRRRTPRKPIRRVVRLELWFALVLLVLLAARLDIVVHQLRPGDATEAQRMAAARLYSSLYLAVSTLGWMLLFRTRRVARLLARALRRPSLTLATSFLVLILGATMLLSLPAAVRGVGDISLLDALFTATSAVCVTGLTVNEVGTTYSLFGQGVILCAIQLGGIGMMTLAGFALSLGSSASLGDQAHLVRVMGSTGLDDLRRLARSIVSATLIIEILGAALLYLLWRGAPALAGQSVAWFAVFHAVSAFCNAGITLLPGATQALANTPAVQAVLMALIVSGGIGFLVWRELVGRLVRRVRRWLVGQPNPRTRLGLDAHIVLATSAALVVVGAASFLVVESTGALFDLSLGERVLAALFTSVTSRTAGFSTIDLGGCSDAGLLVVIVLMFVGGSPGSTAGGIKTTTLAVVGATLVAELRGHEPHLYGRALPATVIRRAVAVATLSLVIVVGVTMILSMLEPWPLRAVAFEAVSAFATVGLSTGITGALSTTGKLVIVATMFVGRVGPLTVALSVGQDVARRRHKLPPEPVTIG